MKMLNLKLFLQKIKNLIYLNKLSKFNQSWDKHKAEKFSTKQICVCKQIINSFKIQPQIFPTAKPSIQLEYNLDAETYLELEIYKNKISYLYLPRVNCAKARLFEIALTDQNAINKVLNEVKYAKL